MAGLKRRSKKGHQGTPEGSTSNKQQKGIDFSKYRQHGYTPHLNELEELTEAEMLRIHRKKHRIKCKCGAIHYIPDYPIEKSMVATCSCGYVVFKLKKGTK